MTKPRPFPAGFLVSLVMSACAHADGMKMPHACASIKEADARLACFDSSFSPPSQSDEQTTPVHGEDHALQRFGFSESEIQARFPEDRKDPGPQSVDATVASVGRRAAGRLVVNLTNGQVWIQTEVNLHARLQPGDPVTIRRAALGSFVLVTPGRVATRVRRLE